MSRHTASIVLALVLPAVAADSAASEVGQNYSISEVRSHAAFLEIAEVLNRDTSRALPHVLFVIDRWRNNQIHYVDTKRFRFHKEFLRASYLSLDPPPTISDAAAAAGRRFLLGTVAQSMSGVWTFEFQPNDHVTQGQIALAAEVIGRTFFTPVLYKPNSPQQKKASRGLARPGRVLLVDSLDKDEYQPLNLARGIGRLHLIDRLDDSVQIDSNEIVVVAVLPDRLPPVAGIITCTPATQLAHVNLLARSWKIPSAYLKNACETLRSLNGTWVSFETTVASYKLERAGIDAIKDYERRIELRRLTQSPPVDLTVKRLAVLSEQRRKDAVAYGAKSANLGEVLNAGIPEIQVPGGFTIPFFWYEEFVDRNGIRSEILEMLDENRFVHEPIYRRARLSRLRERFKQGTMNETLVTDVFLQARGHLQGGLFVRSSASGEDLPGFSGAGLYTTVPNVRTDGALIDAIPAVFASVWNYEAFEARERAGMDHRSIAMAVLIQTAVPSTTSGVMVTTDPFDRANTRGIYVSAKRGLGIRVVNGNRVAEEILYDAKTKAIRRLRRSSDVVMLELGQEGGIREVKMGDRREVLTNSRVRRLTTAGERIETLFGSGPQDIEWAMVGESIYILQARPF